MGAWATAPDQTIVAVTGDGGFGQYLAELTTAVKERMNITHVLLNNGQLGKISNEQRAAMWNVWQTALHNPSFAEYAQLCGAHGERVEKSADLDNALSRAFDYDGPALVEVMTDADLV
jgi:thiamine pyrophosphate-dependent acetolactate synthase large subunit-like protein